MSRMIFSTQDVILEFPRRTATDELDRQLQVSLFVSDIAERLYHARCLYIGGSFHEWHELTPGQQQAFRKEVEALITSAKGDK